jgi:spermidine synthase
MIPIYESDTVRVIEMVDADGDTQRLLTIGPEFAPWQGGFKTNKPDFHVHQFTRHLTYGALCVTGSVRNALFLGFGAGITMQAVRTLFPLANVDIIDTNAELFEVSRKFFFDIDADNVRVFTSDAYDFVHASTIAYDYVCCDIAAGGLEVPDFLLADAFYSDAKRLLTDGGIFSINTQWPHHKAISELLVRHFRYVVSCQGNNSTFIAGDSLPTAVVAVDLKERLKANNIDVDAIRDNQVILHAARNGSCQLLLESAHHERLLNEILASRSWRLTAPLRRLARLIRPSKGTEKADASKYSGS